MSRPAMRQPAGRWSLAQVHTQAGVSLAIARRVAGLAWLDAEQLSEDDVVVLQVAASLLNAPKPSGPTRSHAGMWARNEQALTLAREHLRAPSTDPNLTMIITPETATVAKDLITLMNALNETVGTTRLLLPLGEWIAALPSRNNTQVAS